jgi:Tol biopolymer transport system component
LQTYLDYDPNGTKDIMRPWLSFDGKWIAYTELDFSKTLPYQYHIIVWNIDSKQGVQVGDGINAAISPDNQLIAYTWFDGIYVMAIDGTNKRRLVEYDARGHNDFGDAPPAPRWSPDGKWLVYHKCLKGRDACYYAKDYSIFRVEVASGFEAKILDGGAFPFWRGQ